MSCDSVEVVGSEAPSVPSCLGTWCKVAGALQQLNLLEEPQLTAPSLQSWWRSLSTITSVLVKVYILTVNMTRRDSDTCGTYSGIVVFAPWVGSSSNAKRNLGLSVSHIYLYFPCSRDTGLWPVARTPWFVLSTSAKQNLDLSSSRICQFSGKCFVALAPWVWIERQRQTRFWPVRISHFSGKCIGFERLDGYGVLKV